VNNNQFGLSKSDNKPSAASEKDSDFRFEQVSANQVAALPNSE
jgi:hypothetical protein